jgi:peptide/nickel transport system substrate-binding protein
MFSGSRQRLFPALLALVILGCFASQTALASSTSKVATANHSPRGSLQALLTGGEWPNLDPALDTQAAADATMMDAVFGGLFEFPAGQPVIDDEASGYKFINNGMTFEITLRHGLTFSNGDPLNATVVAANINRDLLPANACICAPDFAAVSSVAASGSNTVVFTLSRPFPSLVYSFDATAPNWMADLSVLAQKGSGAFGQDPVGSGPFEIVSNSASATLALQANPHYWQAGHPLLENLTFVSIGSDESAYDSILAGQSQVSTNVTTIPLAVQARSDKSVKVLVSPATGYNFVEMNAKAPPFNNILAREAIYYATDPASIVKNLYHGIYKVVESATASGETVYLPTIPGYRTYNLKKAKALVQQLGGLTVTLGGLTNTQYWETEQGALAAQWEQAGITVNIQVNSLQNYLQELGSGNWQALDTQWATPAPELGLPSHFSSTAPLSGTHDPAVDALMNQAAATTDPVRINTLYKKLFETMNTDADVAFLYSKPVITIVSKKVSGTAAVANSFWEDVS